MNNTTTTTIIPTTFVYTKPIHFHPTLNIPSGQCCIVKNLEGMHDYDYTKETLLNRTSLCFTGNFTTTEKLHLVIKTAQNFDIETCRDSPCMEATNTISYIYMIFWILLLILTVLSNSLVISAVLKISFLKHNVANAFIASLAASDLLVGLFYIPINISKAYHNSRFCHNDLACRFHITTDNTFFSVSVTSLFVITLDRYLALRHSYTYQTQMTSSRSKIIIGFVWLYGCVCGLLTNFKWDNTSKPSILLDKVQFECQVNNPIYTCLIFTLVFYIPVIIMGFLYFRIFAIAQYHARNITKSMIENFSTFNDSIEGRERSYTYSTHLEDESPMELLNKTETDENQNVNTSNERTKAESNQSDQYHKPRTSNNRNTSQSSSTHSKQNTQYRRMIIKTIKTISVVYGTFVCCWLPVSIIAILRQLCTSCFKDTTSYKWLFVLLVEVLPILNSTLNFFIYAALNRQYMKAFKQLFRMFRRKSNTRGHTFNSISRAMSEA